MSTYTYASELRGRILKEGDIIKFSGGLVAEVVHGSYGWWLGISECFNREIFDYLYGISYNYAELVALTEELGGDPVTTISGDFPYQKTATGLTNVATKLLIKQEQNRLDEFDFNKFHPEDQLKGAPLDLIKRLCLNQVKQGNRFDPKVFDRDIRAGILTRGMCWEYSEEGFDYWNKIVSAREKEIETSVPILISDKKDSSLILLTAKKKKSILSTL